MQGKILFAVVVAICCCQCGRNTPVSTEVVDLDLPTRFEGSAEPISPIALEQNLPAATVLLGNRLYHDTRLSGSQRISCATCHPVDGTGTVAGDQATSDEASYYDIPTIFNTGSHFAYFWNGRAQNLEDVVEVSIRAENIMNAAWGTVLPRLAEDQELTPLFQAAYPDEGLSETTVVDALATYVRSLVTPNAAFDRWLNGENLSEDVMAGYQLFTDYGCIRCHQGVGIGGNMYASFRNYIEAKSSPQNTDNGRFNVTSIEEHRYQFKVPSLRNVAVTAPYFHDGAVDALDDAVEAMAQYQLGRTLTRSETNQIVAFLESLTGWRDGVLLGGS